MKYFEKVSEEQTMKFFEKVSKDNSFDDLIAGGLAGAAAVFGTQPLEQIATKKIIEPVPVNSTALRKFLHKWKGSGWRALKGTLAAGITFGTYGQIKKMLDAD